MMLFEGLSVFFVAQYFFSHLAPSPLPPSQVVHNFLGGWPIAFARMFSNIKITTESIFPHGSTYMILLCFWLLLKVV